MKSEPEGIFLTRVADFLPKRRVESTGSAKTPDGTLFRCQRFILDLREPAVPNVNLGDLAWQSKAFALLCWLCSQDAFWR